MKNLFGLLGFPLGHSFSKGYFTDKFHLLELAESHAYEKFELEGIHDFIDLIKNNPNLRGLNVTIPYKQAIIPFLDELDEGSAKRIGAVNTIKILPNKKLIGYNSDYYGFKNSLENWLQPHFKSQISNLKSLILGNGGASKAVQVALSDLGIAYKIVVRQAGQGDLLFQNLTQEIIENHPLIINTTPLGTFPTIENCPTIPYQFLNKHHFLYDLVYNPTETLFMKKGLAQGCQVKNGYEMLVLQAEKAWEIWND